VVAVDRRSNDVVEVGRTALFRIEREPGSLAEVWPMRNGCVADAELAQRFIARVLRPSGGTFRDRLRVVAAVPAVATPIERRIVREAGKKAGAAEVRLIEHTMAAALGADLPVHEPIGTMILDVGAGVIEAALISLGSVVASSSVRSGSGDVDVDIRSLLKRDYGMVVSDRTSEDIKLALAHAGGREQFMIEARGQVILDGSTITAILERDEVQSVVHRHVEVCSEAVRATLVQAPPELAQDVITNGIHLVGGGAQLDGLAEHLSERFKIPVHLVDEPERVVVRGAGKCLEAMDRLRSLFVGESAQANA